MNLPFLRFLFLSEGCYKLGAGNFVLLFSLFNAVLFQWPLYLLAISTRAGMDASSVLAIATLFILQLMISLAVLGLAAIISTRLLKLLCVLITVVNSCALYFIVQYKVGFDATMIGNIVNTNIAEASELAHPKLLLYVTLLGLLPAWFLIRVPIAATTRLQRGTIVLLTLVAGSGWLYANAQSWLWIDKNAKVFGGLVLPWSYVINSVRFYKAESDRSRVVELLPSLTTIRPGGMVFVLVIGEAARAQNFSIYGYPRDTNTQLRRVGVMAYPDAQSCATYTTASLRCMLSHTGEGGLVGNAEPLPSYLYRHGIEVIWRTNNFGEPPIKVSRYETANQIRTSCTRDCIRLDYDEVLLHGLDELVRNGAKDKKTLIVLHQGGSHGPQYARKYPPEFERFRPACQGVDLQKCSFAELVNAYDNTIVYTDTLLYRVIQLLASNKTRPSAMLYMSDHGESLGEGGLYLHGVPKTFAPQVQFSVPLLVWASDEFRRGGGGSKSPMSLAVSPTHDVVFHSVMGAMGLISSIYVPQKDLFQFTQPTETTTTARK